MTGGLRNYLVVQVFVRSEHILTTSVGLSRRVKVHLTNCGETELLEILSQRAAATHAHALVDSAEEADLVLMLGNFGRDPEYLLEHPAYRQFPDKCAVYTEDDNYLPLAPGVYCSAREDRSTRVGRVFSYTYVSRNGRYKNPYLSEPNLDQWTEIQATTPKRYLFSFQGGSTSWVRKRLFNLRFDRPDVLIESTSNYYHWDDSQPDRRGRQLAYAEVLAASHFVLCPRGAGLGSIRFFEAMAKGIAPVLISDGYVLPPGPDWDSFLIRVPERAISKLVKVIEPHLSEAAERGRRAREAFREHFAMRREFDRIVDLAAEALRHSAPEEAAFRKEQPAMIRRLRWRSALRDAARAAALKTMRAVGMRNPYQMNR